MVRKPIVFSLSDGVKYFDIVFFVSTIAPDVAKTFCPPNYLLD
jgi:hypothetical protein